MKPIAIALALCLSATSLSACVTKANPARTEVSYPGGKIIHHCPPGQRKKGNCY